MGDDFSTTVNFDTTGMKMIVSGSANEITYEYSADQIALSIADLMIKGDKIKDTKINLILRNLSGKTTSVAGDLRQITQTVTAEMITYEMAISAPEGGSITVEGSIADFAMNSDSSMPESMDFQNMSAALAAGFGGKGALTWGAGGYEFSAKSDDSEVTGKSTSDSGSLNFAMTHDSLNYGGTANGNKISITSSDLPFPIDVSIAESAFNILMPISKTDTPSDFAMTIKLGDFTINDAIWSLFDPGANLSRDPATILLDFTGKANWLIDIMNPEAAMEMDIDMPGQLHALTLKALQIKAVGAELTGSGAFTFNNDDLETFDGMPAPTGMLDLKLTGGNGLM
ncbi:hypothetical protein JI58_00115, partial [Marinosulfonomonas sp. PRT-SC04]